MRYCNRLSKNVPRCAQFYLGWDHVDSAAFYWQFKRNEDTIVKKTYFFRNDEYVRYNDDQLKVRLITKTKKFLACAL